jgi:hypothetical protein
MAYRKVYIAVDCDSDAEALAVQAFAKEASQMFRLKARDVLSLAPTIKKNGSLIVHAVKTISAEGMKGVAKIVPYFIGNIKK